MQSPLISRLEHCLLMNGALVAHLISPMGGATLTLEELKTDPYFWPYIEPYCGSFRSWFLILAKHLYIGTLNAAAP
jgi:hypothetical protein